MRRMLKSIAMATLVGLFVAPSAVIAQGQDGVLGQDMNVVDIELDTIETTRKRLAWIKMTLRAGPLNTRWMMLLLSRLRITQQSKRPTKVFNRNNGMQSATKDYGGQLLPALDLMVTSTLCQHGQPSANVMNLPMAKNILK